ncbi:hypothetical protein F5B21DRAFT_506227 [Xylaria acuta]|nr:hypothetical protein F5B21DRAFT_506227 [Xylaria acuta]
MVEEVQLDLALVGKRIEEIEAIILKKLEFAAKDIENQVQDWIGKWPNPKDEEYDDKLNALAKVSAEKLVRHDNIESAIASLRLFVSGILWGRHSENDDVNLNPEHIYGNDIDPSHEQESVAPNYAANYIHGHIRDNFSIHGSNDVYDNGMFPIHEQENVPVNYAGNYSYDNIITPRQTATFQESLLNWAPMFSRRRSK